MAEQSVALCVVGIECASLVLRATSIQFSTNTTIPASSIDLAAAICIGATVYIEHRHSIRSSALFTLYLLAGVLTDAAKSRSFFLRPGMTYLGGLVAAASALKLVLVGLQEVSKRSALIDGGLRRSVGHEATSGFLSRLIFLFLRPIFALGFGGQISLHHLSELDPEFAPERLYAEVKPHWQVRRGSAAASSSHRLLWACLKAWKRHFFALVFARLVVTGFNFAQPFILRRIIDMVGKANHSPNDMNERGGLFGSSAIVFFGLALSKANSAHLMNRYITRVRGSCIALIFHKEHNLSEARAKDSAAATLMSTDVDGIVTGMPRCLEIPIGMIEIALGIWVLSGFVGVSAFAVFAPLLVTTAMTFFLGRRMAPQLANWNLSIERRINHSTIILSQLIPIKMQGLGPTVGTFLQHLRLREIKTSKAFRTLEALVVGPIVLGDLMTPVVVIAAALFGKAFHGQMAAAKVFPTLAVVNLIQRPLITVLAAFPTITGMLACFSRIQAFLLLPDRKDCRITRSSSAILNIRQNEPATPEPASTEPVAMATVPPQCIVKFNDADVAPPGMTTPLLQQLNFELMAGSVTGVIGVTGSGKSTIANGIVGYSKVLGGSIEVATDDIAFCSQTVWLQNATIRDNVTGYLEYDEERFQKVIKACFLEEDLEWLPGGADYVVGTNGCNLSGGQRQRVALARAAFAARSLVILDDAFSSLDHDTAVCVLYQLCGRNGIFRQSGSTVIFVSYLPDALKVADQLLFVDGQTATLNQLSEIADLAERVVSALNTINRSVPLADEKKQQSFVRRSLEEGTLGPAVVDATLRQQGSLNLYMLFINPIGKIKSTLHGLFISLMSAGELIPDIYIRIWIETDPANSEFFIGYAAIGLTTCVIACLTYWLLHTKLTPRSSAKLHEQLLLTTIAATLSFLSATKAGDLVNRFGTDMTLLSRDLPSSFLRTIYAGVSGLGSIGIVLSGASYMSIALPFVFVALFFVQRYYLRTSRQVRHLDLEMRAPLYTYFQETATGLTHIQAFRWEKENIQRGYSILEESQKPFYVLLAIQQWLGLILSLLTATLGVILIATALFVRYSSSEASVGLSFVSLLTLSYVLEQTVLAWAVLETSCGALARLSTYNENTPQERKESRTPVPVNWPSRGRILIKEVDAHYNRATEVRPVLRELTLAVPPGKRVGIVGRSGSGKSSLLLMLLGFIEYDGKVEIDGIEVSRVPCDILRSRIVTITQEQVRFHATVRTNLLPFTMNDTTPDGMSAAEEEKAAAKDLEIEQLLKDMHIWVQLEGRGGLDAMLDTVGYSKGQLQLLCIARAILRQRETGSKVILVDEATSSIDATTERIAHRIMKQHFNGCTVVTVTHRRASLQGVHSIIGLHRGVRMEVNSLPSDDDTTPDASEESS